MAGTRIVRPARPGWAGRDVAPSARAGVVRGTQRRRGPAGRQKANVSDLPNPPLPAPTGLLFIGGRRSRPFGPGYHLTALRASEPHFPCIRTAPASRQFTRRRRNRLNRYKATEGKLALLP